MSCGPRICGDFLAKPTVGSDLVSSWRGRRSAGYDSAPVAYAVAFRLSCGQVFFSPAAQSLLPSVVDGDEIVAANSGIWTAAVTAQILVAPVAVLLAVHVGFGVVFAVNAVSTVVLRGLREPERTTPVQVSSPARARPRGPRGSRRAAAAQSTRCRAVPRGAIRRRTSALLVVLAQDRLGGGSGFGVLVAAIGAGAALGPFLLLRRITEPRRPVFVFGPYAVRGVVDLVLAVATSVPLAACALVLYGLSTSSGNVTFTRIIQSRVLRTSGAGRSPASTCSGRRAGF